VDVAVNHGAGNAEILGDKLGGLVLEFDTFKDLKLAEWDPVAEVFDERGQQRTAEGCAFPHGFKGNTGLRRVGD